MNSDFLQKLQCPECGTSLEENNNTLLCPDCNENFPIVNGIAVLRRQEQLADFFNQESVQEYIEGDKESPSDMQDYTEGLKKIAAFVQQDDYQKKYMVNACDRSDLNNDEIERANQQTYEMLADKAHIAEASTILDWPTGKGCFLRTMLDKVQQDSMIICLDIDFIELAALKAYLQNQQKADNVYFVNADVRQMPLQSEVFDAVTARGGFIEVPEAPKAISESYRVLKQGGCFAGDGEVYEENSESIKIAERIGVGYLISQDRIEDCIADSGFRDIYTESVFEDYDRTEPGPDRCPLPAHGDWFGIIVASGRK
jgi:ubiquinone/menaquinone biosynthesis C-methylase UbiE/uncharacterized protein YbaR (Trm112 family)